ncbi:MAG: hypothetical protein DMG26_03550, partial [Acidobacteria bacterium]
MLDQYGPVLIFAVIAAVFPLATLWLTKFVRPTPKPTEEKLMPYECGITPESDSRGRYTVRFYLIAILFVIFDVEAKFARGGVEIRSTVRTSGSAARSIGFRFVLQRRPGAASPANPPYAGVCCPARAPPPSAGPDSLLASNFSPVVRWRVSLISPEVSQMPYKGLSLEGKKALVFGGTSGLGKSIALGFAEAGADVVPVSRRSEE